MALLPWFSCPWSHFFAIVTLDPNRQSGTWSPPEETTLGVITSGLADGRVILQESVLGLLLLNILIFYLADRIEKALEFAGVIKMVTSMCFV